MKKLIALLMILSFNVYAYDFSVTATAYKTNEVYTSLPSGHYESKSPNTTPAIFVDSSDRPVFIGVSINDSVGLRIGTRFDNFSIIGLFDSVSYDVREDKVYQYKVKTSCGYRLESSTGTVVTSGDEYGFGLGVEYSIGNIVIGASTLSAGTEFGRVNNNNLYLGYKVRIK